MRLLALTVYGLNVADLALTRIGLSQGAVESNPFAVEIADDWRGVVLKLLAVPVVLLLILFFAKQAPRFGRFVLSAAFALYVGVVVWNVGVVLS